MMRIMQKEKAFVTNKYRRRMAVLTFALGCVSANCSAQQQPAWILPNFSDRLDLNITNTQAVEMHGLAVVPVATAAKIAGHFPGTLAIVVSNDGSSEVLPSQADDLDGDGTPDEFVFPVHLAPQQTRAFEIYYSATLRDPMPWPSRVSASHAFGYNRATAALESTEVGYRTYGGFFLDIQARMNHAPGLNNQLVGYLGTKAGLAYSAGRDVFHIGQTLGLGGIFLRSAGVFYRPPLNMPDYAHKPAPQEAPVYRVIASGPVRAMIEARMDRWSIGDDSVRISATYSIAAGAEVVECRYQISPLSVSHAYQVGAGIRHLPAMKTSSEPGRLALVGTQNAATGSIGLAVYYDPDSSASTETLPTPDDSNEAVLFKEKLEPGQRATGRYWIAGAWSGTGIEDLSKHLAEIQRQATARLKVDGFRHHSTPSRELLEGEAP